MAHRLLYGTTRMQIPTNTDRVETFLAEASATSSHAYPHRRVRALRVSHVRGFTLIELMAVVTIVGILAVLAVLGFRKLVIASHTTEATGVCGAIKTAQTRFFGDTSNNYYANVSGTLSWTASGNTSPSNQNYYPAVTTPGAFKTQWGGPCTGTQCTSPSWIDLAVPVDAQVMYGYTTVAGAAGVASSAVPTFTVNGTAVTVVSPIAPWFATAATGDPDGNQTFSNVLSYSFTNQMFIDNEGE
jgi:type IV pilus assembly protein PilA